MSPAPNDPLTADMRRQSSTSKVRRGLLIIAFSLLAACIYFLYTNHLYQDQSQQVEQPAPAEQGFRQEPVPLTLEPIPSFEIPQLNLDADLGESKPIPQLPGYEEANSFIKQQFELERWQTLNINPKNLPALNKDFLLQRTVAFLDGLSKGVIIDKLLPFPRPRMAFIADKQGSTLSMGAANFQRYDVFTQTIISIDTAQAAKFFHWTRPLLETAYGELGYPGEDLGTALIAAIDSLLATPRIKGSISLKRESVLYQFSDPTIEALPGAQKQLLRMGAENSTRLKRWLSQLRSALLAPGENQKQPL